jgi:hypothetical protein
VPDGPDRDALVIRLRPLKPEAMLEQAKKAFRDGGHHYLSVYSDKRRDDETEADLVTRLLNAAEVSNILRANNPKYWFCQKASDLLDDGFIFVKDGYDGEMPEHWSIDLGENPTVADTTRLSGHFPDSRKWDQ